MADKTLYTVRAEIKGIDLAPRKVKIVSDLVRGRSVDDALVILEHTPRRSARPVAKAIASARANAINNHGLDGKSLIISTLSVTAGPRLKRFKPHMRGMALPFQKKSSHILVEVAGTEKPKKKPAAKKAEAASSSKKEEEKN